MPHQLWYISLRGAEEQTRRSDCSGPTFWPHDWWLVDYSEMLISQLTTTDDRKLRGSIRLISGNELTVGLVFVNFKEQLLFAITTGYVVWTICIIYGNT